MLIYFFNIVLSTFWTSLVNTLDHHGEAITALFTVVLAISTILLWWATRGLRKDTLETIEATKKSAEAALTANDLQRRHLVANYRPWILVDLSPVRFFRSDETFVLTFRCTLKNEGASTAVKAGIHCEIALNEYVIRDIHNKWSEYIRGENLGIGPKVSVRSERTAEVEESVALSLSDLKQTRSNSDTVLTFAPILVGTVFYYSMFSDELFETRFAATLYKRGEYDWEKDIVPRHRFSTEDHDINSLMFDRLPLAESFT